MAADHDFAEPRERGLPLDLERVETRMYRGWPSRSRPPLRSIFGGGVVAQALLAAGMEVPAERFVHSLHAYFLRRGDPEVPVLYRVEDRRIGSSFTARSVVATQRGEALLTMTASFHGAETGPSHQDAAGAAPPPEPSPLSDRELEAMDSGHAHWLDDLLRQFPVDVRFVDPPPRVTARGPAMGRFRYWVRSRARLPSVPIMHAGAAAYISDLLLLANGAARHGLIVGQPGLQLASLDHAMWFHRPPRADDWLLYEQRCEWTGGSRALCRGALFDTTGNLVATVVQEGLIRQW